MVVDLTVIKVAFLGKSCKNSVLPQLYLNMTLMFICGFSSHFVNTVLIHFAFCGVVFPIKNIFWGGEG